MARYLIPSDTFLKAIKPGDPRKRLGDGDGLLLLLFVKPGHHGWRFDYRFAGRRNMLSFGNYPDTTLAIARRKADAARRPLAGRRATATRSSPASRTTSSRGSARCRWPI